MEITSKDYPGEVFIKGDDFGKVSFIKNAKGAVYYGLDVGELKISGGKIYVNGHLSGQFGNHFLFFPNYRAFELNQKNYLIEEKVIDSGVYVERVLCDGRTVAEVEYQGYSRVLLKEKHGWVKVSGYTKDHYLGCLLSLFYFEKEIRPSENG